MIRMKHQQHGFHHAYDGNEEARMRATGWVADTEPFPGEATPDDVLVIEQPAPKPAPRRKR